MAKENKKSLGEEFAIGNFLNKEKEHGNKWTNQHRFNTGKRTTLSIKKFLKKVSQDEKNKSG